LWINGGELSDAQKIAGISGALGNTLQAIQPHLAVAAAKYKAIAAIALKILSQLIPGLNIADMKLPGPKLFGGNSKKPGGGNEKPKPAKKAEPGKGSGSGGAKEKSKSPRDLNEAEKASKKEKVEQAKNDLRAAMGMPKDATSAAPPHKVDPEKLKDVAATAVSGGNSNLANLVRLRLQQYSASADRYEALAEIAADIAVQLSDQNVGSSDREQK
jgi:hypothetical protein